MLADAADETRNPLTVRPWSGFSGRVSHYQNGGSRGFKSAMNQQTLSIYAVDEVVKCRKPRSKMECLLMLSFYSKLFVPRIRVISSLLLVVGGLVVWWLRVCWFGTVGAWVVWLSHASRHLRWGWLGLKGILNTWPPAVIRLIPR